MQKASISCVIVNYNSSDMSVNLAEQLSAYQIIEKIIIVDNASRTDEYHKLDRFKNHGKVKVLRSEKNVGYGAGNNVGIDYVYKNLDSRYIIIANPDIAISERGIIKMKLFLDSNPSYALTTLRAISPDPERYKKYLNAWKIHTFWNDLFKFEMLYSRMYEPKYKQLRYENEWIDVDVVEGCMFMIRTEVMHIVGGYDERMFLYGEEVLLGIKLQQAKYKSAILLNDIFVHDHKSSTTLNVLKSNIERRNILKKSKWIIWKYYYKINIFEQVLAKIFLLFTDIEAFIVYLLVRKGEKK